MYYLASLKLSGWLSRTSQYTTDIKEAKQFTRDEALAMASRHKSASNVLVPVRVEDMEAIA